MKVRVPAAAPGTPPETGASNMSGLSTFLAKVDH